MCVNLLILNRKKNRTWKQASDHGTSNWKILIYYEPQTQHSSWKREGGTIIQSYLFRLDASPDGFIFDINVALNQMLSTTKCSHNKRNLSIESIITDKTFYAALKKDKKQYLKKQYQFG